MAKSRLSAVTELFSNVCPHFSQSFFIDGELYHYTDQRLWSIRAQLTELEDANLMMLSDRVHLEHINPKQIRMF